MNNTIGNTTTQAQATRTGCSPNNTKLPRSAWIAELSATVVEILFSVVIFVLIIFQYNSDSVGTCGVLFAPPIFYIIWKSILTCCWPSIFKNEKNEVVRLVIYLVDFAIKLFFLLVFFSSLLPEEMDIINHHEHDHSQNHDDHIDDHDGMTNSTTVYDEHHDGDHVNELCFTHDNNEGEIHGILIMWGIVACLGIFTNIYLFMDNEILMIDLWNNISCNVNCKSKQKMKRRISHSDIEIPPLNANASCGNNREKKYEGKDEGKDEEIEGKTGNVIV